MKVAAYTLLFALLSVIGLALTPDRAFAQDNPNFDNTVGLRLPTQLGPIGGNTVNVITTPDGYDNFDLSVNTAEPHISTNPLNPLWFFNAFNINSAYRTTDGTNWIASSPDFGTSPAGDPVTAYDSLGNLYYETMYGGISGCKVIRSTDNGTTWTAAVTSIVGVDKNWIAADQTMGPYANYVYTTMTRSGGGNFARSTDFGATWTNTFAPTTQSLPGMMVAVGPNVAGGNNVSGGCVYVVTHSGTNAAGIYTFYVSTDGGVTFAQKSTNQFSNLIGTEIGGRSTVQGMRCRPYPFIASDNSFGLYRGRLYLVYASNSPAGSGNKSDVFLRYSTDQGATWSAATAVNDDATSQNNFQFHPAIWCDKTTGRLYIQFYDTRNTPTSDSMDVYATYTDDGGVTYAPNQRVTNRKFKINITGGGGPNYQGDYNAITSNRYTSMAVWSDFRNNNFLGMTGYFPDFAMLLSQSSVSLGLADSVNVRVKVPSVKLYTGVAKFSASVSPAAPFTLSFVGGRDSLTAYPDSVTLKIRTNNVIAGIYTVTITGSGPNGTPVHRRTVTVDANTNANTVTLTAPNGAENWISGSVQNITWVPTGSVNTVKLEYSTNNGTAWSTIIASVPAVPSTYAWTVPTTPTTQGRVRVSWTDSATVNDMSNSPFTISIGSITVTAPNGGENWPTGGVRNITWARTGVVNSVKLEYSTNNGTAWSTIIASVPAVPSTYAWTVPTTPTTQGLVRVSWTVSDTINDMSNGPFTISVATFPIITTSPDSITVTLPVGGGTTDRTLTIGNTGTAALNWAISEAAASPTLPYIRQPQAEELYPNWETGKGEADRYHGPEPAQGDTIVGPDSAGYRAIDSDSPGGPTYNWFDISTIGTQITTWTGTADDGYATISLPFQFSFYGATYNSLNVCTNGFVNFGATSTAYTNGAIPSVAAPNNACYGLWDDLTLTSSGAVHYYFDTPNSRFIIQYTDVPFYSGGGTVKFQIILKSTGEILYQYNTFTGATNSCTIGIENLGGTVALQLIYNANYLHNSLAVLISKGLSWVEESPSSGSVAPSGSQPVTVTFNSANLTVGTYTGNLVVTSNDVPRSPRNIPIRLSVGPTDVNEGQEHPREFALAQNYPNPFNPTTTISYALPTQATVRLRIFDMLGQEVTTLVDGPQPGGHYSVTWTGNSDRGFLAASGVYTYRIEATTADGKSLKDMKKMLLLK
jgi:hypothetical protein